MTCGKCGNTENLLWAHNGGIGTHHWGDGEEKDCGCGPVLVCAECDAPLLKQHGFVVLDAVCFGFTHETLQ